MYSYSGHYVPAIILVGIHMILIIINICNQLMLIIMLCFSLCLIGVVFTSRMLLMLLNYF